MVTTWSDVEGYLEIQLFKNEDGEICDVATETPINIDIPEIGEDTYLGIVFMASGYYDPGQCYGPVETSYPPEGEEERALEECYILHNGNVIEISKKDQIRLFDKFIDYIYKVKLDYPNIEDNWEQYL